MFKNLKIQYDTNYHYILIALLSSILLFSISCSSSKDPKESSLSYYAGNWYYTEDNVTGDHIFTVNSDDSLTVTAIIEGGENMTIPKSEITRNSETSYTYYYQGNSYTVNFTSQTQAKFTMEGVDKEAIITKK